MTYVIITYIVMVAVLYILAAVKVLHMDYDKATIASLVLSFLTLICLGTIYHKYGSIEHPDLLLTPAK